MKTPRGLRSAARCRVCLDPAERRRFSRNAEHWPGPVTRLMGASRSTQRIWADFGVSRQRFRKPCADERKTL